MSRNLPRNLSRYTTPADKYFAHLFDAIVIVCTEYKIVDFLDYMYQ